MQARPASTSVPRKFDICKTLNISKTCARGAARRADERGRPSGCVVPSPRDLQGDRVPHQPGEPGTVKISRAPAVTPRGLTFIKPFTYVQDWTYERTPAGVETARGLLVPANIIRIVTKGAPRSRRPAQRQSAGRQHFGAQQRACRATASHPAGCDRSTAQKPYPTANNPLPPVGERHSLVDAGCRRGACPKRLAVKGGRRPSPQATRSALYGETGHATGGSHKTVPRSGSD